MHSDYLSSVTQNHYSEFIQQLIPFHCWIVFHHMSGGDLMWSPHPNLCRNTTLFPSLSYVMVLGGEDFGTLLAVDEIMRVEPPWMESGEKLLLFSTFCHLTQWEDGSLQPRRGFWPEPDRAGILNPDLQPPELGGITFWGLWGTSSMGCCRNRLNRGNKCTDIC